jgi:RNA recognition motif-containing protein
VQLISSKEKPKAAPAPAKDKPKPKPAPAPAKPAPKPVKAPKAAEPEPEPEPEAEAEPAPEAEPAAEEEKMEDVPKEDGAPEAEAEAEPKPEPEAAANEGGDSEEVELFIGNLPFSATEETVANHFAKYGEVVSVKLLQRVRSHVSWGRMADLRARASCSSSRPARPHKLSEKTAVTSRDATSK